MNYYNPYFTYPYLNSIPTNSGGILSRLFGRGINWSSLLSGTQKTLSVVNQAIPLVKQVSPVMKNAKTMFKIMNEFKKVDTPVTNNNQIQNINLNEKDKKIEDSTIEIKTNNGPTFFI